MGRDEGLLGVGLAVCAAAIVGVMLLPAKGSGRIIDSDPVRDGPESDGEAEPEVTITPPPRAGSLKPVRAHLLPDGGPGTVDAQSKVLVSFGWGSSKAQLGRARPRDGQPEAPMSVAADAAGNTWVLDQVNSRIVRLGGEAPIPVGLRKPRDLAVAKNGNAIVVSESTALVLGGDGHQVAEWKLPLKPEGVYADGDDVYVGLEGGATMRIGDTLGAADAQRPELPGWPTRDGRSYVSATLADGARGRVVVMGFDRASKERRFIREIAFGMPVMNVLLIDSDAAGVIYLAAMGERVPGGGYLAEPVPVVDLLCLDPIDGKPLSRTELPANTSADETTREMAALPGGGVVYLLRSEGGAELRRVDCR
ncbi:MAG: hypothetical protein JNK82_38425 [Myxococcaceae bacterium]|nr:hypothetical protein [Myxococcaceae bacterium]